MNSLAFDQRLVVDPLSPGTNSSTKSMIVRVKEARARLTGKA